MFAPDVGSAAEALDQNVVRVYQSIGNRIDVGVLKHDAVIKLRISKIGGHIQRIAELMLHSHGALNRGGYFEILVNIKHKVLWCRSLRSPWTWDGRQSRDVI